MEEAKAQKGRYQSTVYKFEYASPLGNKEDEDVAGNGGSSTAKSNGVSAASIMSSTMILSACLSEAPPAAAAALVVGSIAAGAVYLHDKINEFRHQMSKGGKQGLWDDELSPLPDFHLESKLREAERSGDTKMKQRINREQKRRGDRNKQKRDNQKKSK